ncbi:MAG: hypothetical protein ABJA16_09205, partial [Nakamurella sp.]
SHLLETKPAAGDLRETLKMLDLIAEERPAMAPISAYWRAVARLHEHNYDEAARSYESNLLITAIPAPA